jgi:hypothetical protein
MCCLEWVVQDKFKDTEGVIRSRKPRENRYAERKENEKKGPKKY